MPTVQQSIEISVPVHTAYNQLTHFEEYPHFMQDIETVQQLDDTHLHWSSRLSYQTMEWDSEITEQVPDRCIAWRNLNGPAQAGKVELQAVGPDKARVTLTIEADADQVAGAPHGNSEAAMTQRLEQDLMRFKQFIETSGSDARSQPVATSSYAAGSEGWAGDEDPAEPVVSAARDNTGTGAGTGAGTPDRQPASTYEPSPEPEADEIMLAAASLSQASDEQAEDGRFSVAEEQNFDQQSDQARRVGQMPQNSDAAGANPPDAMAQSMKREEEDQQEAKGKVRQSIERAVPPSE
jgi:Polyketide cyclase / dehydrase and lipid transport